jgi:hypothetical protein
MIRVGHLGLTELKDRAEVSGYTKIRRRVDGAPSVSLARWTGVVREAGPFFNADVWYNLDGAVLVVHKTGVPDTYYDLA